MNRWRFLAFVLVAGSLYAGLGLRPWPVVDGLVSASADPQTCGCPQIPAVATSKNPAPGKVQWELSQADLQAIFSNRVTMFGGSWDLAFQALARDLDPTGALGIAVGPPLPRPVVTVPLVEGGMSRYLLTGQPAVYNPTNRWSGETTTKGVMTALLQTLARVNKYGEPTKNLRAGVLRAVRFLVEDLGRVPLAAIQQPGQGRRLADQWSSAETDLSNAIAMVGQDYAALAPSEQAKKIIGEKNDLPLTWLDVANAALDVLWSYDENGQEGGVFTFGDRAQSSFYLVTWLAGLASARSAFGGVAAPNSAYDAVACKALSTLVRLMGTRNESSRNVRTEVLRILAGEVLQADLPAANLPQLRAGRAAFMLAGFESAQDASEFAETLFIEAENAVGHDMKRGLDETLIAIKGIAAAAPTNREAFTAPINTRVRELEERIAKCTAEGGSPENCRLLIIDRWRALGPPDRVAAGLPCIPEPGKAKGRIFLYAQCIRGLQYIEEFYLGVPTIIEAQFDPPYKQDEYELEISVGDQKLKLIARRLDEEGYIFRTDPFIPGVAKQDKSKMWQAPAQPTRSPR